MNGCIRIELSPRNVLLVTVRVQLERQKGVGDLPKLFSQCGAVEGICKLKQGMLCCLNVTRENYQGFMTDFIWTVPKYGIFFDAQSSKFLKEKSPTGFCFPDGGSCEGHLQKCLMTIYHPPHANDFTTATRTHRPGFSSCSSFSLCLLK